MIKGFNETDTVEFVNYMIESMQLQMYKNKKTGILSGGNKRKVNVGIALTGNNLIQFYDEPSSGLDPIGRIFAVKFKRKDSYGTQSKPTSKKETLRLF